MVLPEPDLSIRLAEGKKTFTPGERLSMSMDPDDPKMELPGMWRGTAEDAAPTMDDPAQRFLQTRGGIRGKFRQRY